MRLGLVIFFATSGPPGQEAPPRLDVGLPSNDPGLQTGAAAEALSAHLAGAGYVANVVTLPQGDLVDHIEWAESREGATGVYFVELVEPGDRRLYLYDPVADRLWVRGLPASDDPGLLAESLGAIVHGTSESLGTQQARRMQPVPRPREPALEATSPSERNRPKPAWTLAVAYVGSSFDDDVPWQSGGHLGVDVQWPVGAWLGASVDVPAPATLDAEPATEVWRIPISIAGGYRFTPHDRVHPGLGLGLVVEPFWWQADSAPAAVGLPGSTARLAVSPSADLRVRLMGGFGVHLGLRADVWVVNAALVVETSDGRARRLRPHPASAVAQLGFHYTF